MIKLLPSYSKITNNETGFRSPYMRPRSDPPYFGPIERGEKQINTRQVLGRPVCDRGAIPRTLVKSNVVRSRLIILINEEINKANWMVSNSAKLDHRTKQHTQFGVSVSNGSRDMARTKSWRKKRKKIKK